MKTVLVKGGIRPDLVMTKEHYKIWNQEFIMKKTYADECLDRTENLNGLCLQYLHDVPELARRLRWVTQLLRNLDKSTGG